MPLEANLFIRRVLRTAPRIAAAAVLGAACASAWAQGYPSKTVRIVVPFAPGGPSDIVARSIATRMQASTGQTVMVENKPGANGAIAIADVLRFPPDGYHLLVASIGPFAINPAVYPKLPYDAVADLEPISLAVTTPNVLVAHPKFPANTVSELVAYAKKNEGKVTYASSGNGSSEHLSIELFKLQTKTQGVHVPYKGGAASLQDLLGGNVDLSFQNLGSASAFIKSGRIKALGVTGEKRHPAMPEVPTMAEQGYPGVVMTAWHALMGPKGMPRDVIEKLHAEVVSALNSPDVKERMAQQGFDVVASSPQQYATFQRNEIERWKKVVQDAGVKAD
jgi:tripartite-type tricarboxylate transporter receptor subunit TctC